MGRMMNNVKFAHCSLTEHVTFSHIRSE